MKLLIMLIVGLFLLSFNTIAQTAQKPAVTPKPIITKDSPTGRAIDQDAVGAFTKTIQDYLNEDLKNYPKSSYMKYSFSVDELQKWLNYQFLEADTEIDINWFKKLHEFVNFFYQTKLEHDLSPLAAKSKFKADNKNKFEIVAKRFDVLIKKPVKANPQRVAYLKREQKKHFEEKRAKERAKERASGNKTSLYD